MLISQKVLMANGAGMACFTPAEASERAGPAVRWNVIGLFGEEWPWNDHLGMLSWLTAGGIVIE
jgi:hypothetical protein